MPLNLEERNPPCFLDFRHIEARSRRAQRAMSSGKLRCLPDSGATAGSDFRLLGRSVFGRHRLRRSSVGEPNTRFDQTCSEREQYLRRRVWVPLPWDLPFYRKHTMAQSPNVSQPSGQPSGQRPPQAPSHDASQTAAPAPSKSSSQTPSQAPSKGASQNPSQSPSKSNPQSPSR